MGPICSSAADALDAAGFQACGVAPARRRPGL